jgi:hypothetical protein
LEVEKAKLALEEVPAGLPFALDEEFLVYPIAVQNQETLLRGNVFFTRNPQER